MMFRLSHINEFALLFLTPIFRDLVRIDHRGSGNRYLLQTRQESIGWCGTILCLDLQLSLECVVRFDKSDEIFLQEPKDDGLRASKHGTVTAARATSHLACVASCAAGHLRIDQFDTMPGHDRLQAIGMH